MSHDASVANDEPELFLKSEPLPAAGSLAEFQLHQAALEWSLADPIIIASEADIKSKPNWQDRLKPFEHQIRNLITFCRRLPVTLLADDVGLGKTISAGLILSELISRNRVRRALVVCPSILGSQWVEELEAKFRIFARFARGSELNHELQSECPVVVTTYQSIQPRLASIQPGQFDMLILDEAHKLRNLYGAREAPKFATEIRKALADGRFQYVLMLTATPIQNRLWDLYSLVDCLAVARGRPNPFDSPARFKSIYIADASQGARRLVQDKKDDFHDILSQYMVRTRRNDVKLLFPKREVKFEPVQPSKLDRQLQSLVADHIHHLNGLQQTSVLQAMMSSPQALVAQLQNMATKDLKWVELVSDVEQLMSQAGLPSKMQGLLELINGLQAERPTDWRLVVFTIRIETQRMICDSLAKDGIAFGTIQGGQPDGNIKTVKRFTQSPPHIHVIVSTDAGAEGLNLQAGNVVVNYDLPWNPMILEQRIGRVQRLAAEHANVFIWNLAVVGSPEERVVKRLIEKLQMIVESVGDIEMVLGADDNDGAESSFEADIRKLVLKSLKGKDVDLDIKLKIESIVLAKDLLTKNGQEIEKMLGRMDAEHTRGPSVPKVTRQTPSRDSQSFTLDVYRADGFSLQPSPTGCLRAEKARHSTEFVTIDETYFRQQSQSGVFNGKLLRLSLPGKPHFEKMVQRWVDRSANAIADLTSETGSQMTELVERWLAARIVGATIDSTQILKRHACFQGRCRLKATASTGVDSYEKLIDLNDLPIHHERVFERELATQLKLKYDEVASQQVIKSFDPKAEELCRSDKDVKAFCDFYSERLREELEKTGRDPAGIRKAENDFRPKIHVQAVSLEGIHYETVRVDVSLRMDGHAGYAVELELCPVTGQVLAEPQDWSGCEVTNRHVPTDFLEQCAISQKLVLRHLLRTSDESGRKALEEFVSVCPVTNRVALQDEFLVSDVSNTRAVASRFASSELSGRRGLLEECVTCDFTNIRLLVDEARRSDISARHYRRDQHGSSVLSRCNGHQSEFVKCEFTQTTVLPSEVVPSGLSGKRLRKDLIEHSTRPPHRVGGPGELQACEITGQRLLTDELARCEVSGRLVDDQLLTRSTSGRLAQPEFLIACEVTEERLLPDEVATSAVSGKVFAKRLARRSVVSGQIALPDECTACEVTGFTVLTDELQISDVSGKKFRRDEVTKSEKSGRTAHRSEAGRCVASKKTLLTDELLRSDVSGRSVDASLAVRSPIGGRIGLPDECAYCNFTGTRVLSDELRQSKVSGKRFRKDEATTSDVSQRIGHQSESGRCAASGKTLLRDELVESAVSGVLIDSNLVYRSPVSGKCALRNECQRCEFSGDLVLPNELIASDVSARWLRQDQVCRSAISGRVGHQRESVRCEYTNRILLCDEVGTSGYSGKCTAHAELFPSDKSGRLGINAEFVVCAKSGQKLLRDEVAQSVLSGKWIDRALLVASDNSAALALPSEMVQCDVTGKSLLPSEVAKSSASELVVDRRLLRTSDLSEMQALENELQQCPVSGLRALPSELEQCSVTQQWVAPSELETCVVTGQRCLRAKLVQSAISARWLLPSEAHRDFRDENILCPDETVYCHWNDGFLKKSDARKCRRTGLTFATNTISKVGDLAVIHRLLRGVEAFDGEALIPWLKKQVDGRLKATANVMFITSKSQSRLFAWLDLQPNLGMWGRFSVIAVIELKNGQPNRLSGILTKCIKQLPGWEPLIKDLPQPIP